MWLWSWLVGWLACTEVLEMPGEGGPICVEAGTFQGFCLGVSCTQMSIASLMVLEWLLTSLCIMLSWLGSMGCPVVVLWRCIGKGALKCSLILSLKVLPDSPIYALGQFMWGALVMIYDSCLVCFRVFVLRVS